MLLFLLIGLVIIFAYVYVTRRDVDKKIPTKAHDEKQQAHLKRLRNDRFVGDFVLTGAAIPALENEVLPEEGYRIYPDAGYFKINGGCLIVVSVSAEKMKQLVLTLIEHIGSVLSISVEDHFSDANRIIDYLSYDRDIFMVENFIERYWRVLQNSYDVQMSIFASVSKVELVLSRVKTVNIHVVDSKPFLLALQQARLIERPNMRFFTEKTYYVYNEYADAGVFHQLTAELQVHEKRFYEKDPVSR